MFASGITDRTSLYQYNENGISAQANFTRLLPVIPIPILLPPVRVPKEVIRADLVALSDTLKLENPSAVRSAFNILQADLQNIPKHPEIQAEVVELGDALKSENPSSIRNAFNALKTDLQFNHQDRIYWGQVLQNQQVGSQGTLIAPGNILEISV